MTQVVETLLGKTGLFERTVKVTNKVAGVDWRSSGEAKVGPHYGARFGSGGHLPGEILWKVDATCPSHITSQLNSRLSAPDSPNAASPQAAVY